MNMRAVLSGISETKSQRNVARNERVNDEAARERETDGRGRRGQEAGPERSTPAAGNVGKGVGERHRPSDIGRGTKPPRARALTVLGRVERGACGIATRRRGRGCERKRMYGREGNERRCPLSRNQSMTGARVRYMRTRRDETERPGKKSVCQKDGCDITGPC